MYTENLWSTLFGNPRCESVQTKEWKYIRYYKNENLSAVDNVKLAKEFNIPLRVMLYEVHEKQFAVYRSFVEGPLNGEEPVYEELYHLAEDANEVHNLIDAPGHQAILDELRAAWKVEVKNARGTGKPKVCVYSNLKSGI